MTIAIESKSVEGGAILYADRNVIANDGTRTQGCKIYSRDLATGSVALASATNNAIAAEGLAMQMLADLESGEYSDLQDMINRIRWNLQNWSEPYPADELDTKFLMVLAFSRQTNLYLLQPRNNIMPVPQKYAIGAGARVVDPILNVLPPEDSLFDRRQTLCRLACMTKHAKEQEAAVGPGGSDAIYIPPSGKATRISPVTLEFAEHMTEFVDETLTFVLHTVMGFASDEQLEKEAETCKRTVINTAGTLTSFMKFNEFAALDEKPENKRNETPEQH
jgi:hypothetical protein